MDKKRLDVEIPEEASMLKWLNDSKDVNLLIQLIRLPVEGLI